MFPVIYNSTRSAIFLLTFLVIYTTSCTRKTGQPITSTTKDSISFLVVGDWGRKGGQAQSDVANEMDVYSRKHNVEFIITTGDNFYPSGVTDISDPHWKLSFEDVYSKSGHRVDWYPTLGNHDYMLNPYAQVEYSLANSRWKMPNRYYSLNKNITDKVSAIFLFTDTSPFIDAYHSVEMSDVNQQDTAAQLDWIKQQLINSDDEWKLIIGHHPVYSAGPHGNTPELIAKLKPVMLQTNTDFHISGHDHSLQHLKLPGEPVDYLISGGGSQATSIKRHPYDQFSRAVPGFMIMTLYSNYARVYFYNKFGRLIYRTDIKP